MLYDGAAILVVAVGLAFLGVAMFGTEVRIGVVHVSGIAEGTRRRVAFVAGIFLIVLGFGVLILQPGRQGRTQAGGKDAGLQGPSSQHQPSGDAVVKGALVEGSEGSEVQQSRFRSSADRMNGRAERSGAPDIAEGTAEASANPGTGSAIANHQSVAIVGNTTNTTITAGSRPDR